MARASEWRAFRRRQLTSTTHGHERLWQLVLLGLLAVGLLLRLALYFPLAAFPADSDGAVTGLCGLQVQDGDLLVFSPDGTRHSAVRCYVAAGFFALLGPGRVGLALTGLVFEALFLLGMMLFLRAVLDAKRACLAMLFVVVPPVQFLIASYVPWGYGEVMAICAAILYFAARWRQAPTLWTSFGFGLSAGLGLWFSLQTIMVSAPALLWVAFRRRGDMIGEAWPAFARSGHRLLAVARLQCRPPLPIAHPELRHAPGCEPRSGVGQCALSARLQSSHAVG